MANKKDIKFSKINQFLLDRFLIIEQKTNGFDGKVFSIDLSFKEKNNIFKYLYVAKLFLDELFNRIKNVFIWEKEDDEIITNYDAITSMNDHDLSEFLKQVSENPCKICDAEKCEKDYNCADGWFDWLNKKREVAENED